MGLNTWCSALNSHRRVASVLFHVLGCPMFGCYQFRSNAMFNILCLVVALAVLYAAINLEALP